MRVKIIHNPYSSRWKSGKRLDELKSAVESAGLNYDLIHTEFPKHGIELGKQAAGESYDAIVAAGGDGTISDVINGIVLGCTDNKLPKFGIMPLGTGNDLADNLNIPIDLLEAAKVIASDKTKQLDLGKANENHFINNTGLGLESYISILQGKMKRLQGSFRYLAATLKGISHNPQWTMQMEWDNGSYEGPVTLVSIGNCARTGGIFYTVPDADPYDGKLSFVYGYIKTRREILSILPKTMNPGEGNYIEHSAIHQKHCTWLKVKTVPNTAFHVDGEIYSRSIDQVEYKVLPGIVPMLVNSD